MTEQEAFIVIRMVTCLGMIVSELSSVHKFAIIEDDPVKAKKDIVKGLKSARKKITALIKIGEVLDVRVA